MPKIDRTSFVKQHQARRLDLGKLAQDPAALRTLERAGVTLDKTERAAGTDKVLAAEEAYSLLEGLRGRARSAAAEALGQLLADPDLQAGSPSAANPAGGQPIDRAGTVFGARLAQTASTRGARDAASDAARPGAGGPGGSSEPLVYVSASTVEDLFASPAAGPLGSYGPLGAYGPLADLGPVGGNAWNAATWIDHAYKTWGSGWDGGKDSGGPLSEAGPLGEKGPLGEAFVDGGFLDQSDALRQLKGLGQQAVLGPLGPLGPLGALGPLGPVGAHGFGADENGTYVDSGGMVQRSIKVWYDEAHTTQNTFELYERYTEPFAKQMTDNDTSFMVEGRLAYAGGGQYEEDAFSFTSHSDQLVTVAVVPEKSLDDFDFEIIDGSGKVLARSDSDHLIDWAQLEVKKGTTLEVRVKLKDSAHWLTKDYRLTVNGSGPQ